MNTTTDTGAERPRAPMLEAVLPACSLCGQTVDYEDRTFFCPSCEAQWPSSSAFAEDGRWSRPDAAQCDAVDRPFSDLADLPDERRLAPYRCYLEQGHRPGPDGSTTHYHPRHPEREWSTGTSAEPELPGCTASPSGGLDGTYPVT